MRTVSPIGSYRYTRRRLRPRDTTSRKACGSGSAVEFTQAPPRSWRSACSKRSRSSAVPNPTVTPGPASARSPPTAAIRNIVLPAESAPSSGRCTSGARPSTSGNCRSQCGQYASSSGRPPNRPSGTRVPHWHTRRSTPYRPGRSARWVRGQFGHRYTGSGTASQQPGYGQRGRIPRAFGSTRPSPFRTPASAPAPSHAAPSSRPNSAAITSTTAAASSAPRTAPSATPAPTSRTSLRPRPFRTGPPLALRPSIIRQARSASQSSVSRCHASATPASSACPASTHTCRHQYDRWAGSPDPPGSGTRGSSRPACHGPSARPAVNAATP